MVFFACCLLLFVVRRVLFVDCRLLFVFVSCLLWFVDVCYYVWLFVVIVVRCVPSFSLVEFRCVLSVVFCCLLFVLRRLMLFVVV